jgi:hypothetical protein
MTKTLSRFGIRSSSEVLGDFFASFVLELNWIASELVEVEHVAGIDENPLCCIWILTARRYRQPFCGGRRAAVGCEDAKVL